MDIRTYYAQDGEKPLDRICDDGGFAAIFRTVACVGDSLSSGEFETVQKDGHTDYPDYYEYSWGQFMARMTGAKVYNFSRGGMSAQWYCETFADERGCWDTDKAAQCYIVALGANDVSAVMSEKIEFGSTDDIAPDWHDNKHTVIGFYGQILARYREISPYAKFFLVTPPVADFETDERRVLYDKLRDTIEELSERYDRTYLIDLRRYAPQIDAEYRKNFFLHGHMNPQGYLLAAKMTASYIDFIVRHHPRDFATAGLICSDNQDIIPLQAEDDEEMA